MKKRNSIKRAFTSLLVGVVLMTSLGMAVRAEDMPYDTYNYDYRENVVLTPAAYVPTGSITGQDLGIDSFIEPQDLCVAPNGEVYVADTKNNRIVVLNHSMNEVVRIIDSFTHDGQEDGFLMPQGVCVSENEQLYVADTDHKRIVKLTTEGEFIRIIDNPQSEILEEGFDFTPLKVTVDYADRVYVIAKNAFEGILVFESNGQFTGYFGTIQVKITLWEKFWRKLASKEERSKQQLFIPTEFTGIDIDSDGFVYASNLDSEGVQGVRRLNPKGEDVIIKGESQNLGGDLYFGIYGEYGGPSEFIDVVYREKGIYSLLDRRRGRIFTYDREGNLLYVFGGLGSQRGTFNTPIAIEVVDDQIIVLDSYQGAILSFGETEYGSLINDAVALRYDGDEALAISKWEAVLKLDENNELANTGMGKAYLTAGDNRAAMHYLKLGMNRKYYSIAFKRYRNEILKENLSLVMTVVFALIALLIVYNKFLKAKIKAKNKKGGLT